MLTSLTLKNYTTFINETTFDFKATNYKILEDINVGSNRVLKGALFVGENASGKTQVLNAIIFLLNMLFKDTELDYGQKSLYTKDPNMQLKYSFDVKNNKIDYEITIKNDAIFKEILKVNDKEIIVRKDTKAKILYNDSEVEVNNYVSILKQEYYNTRFDNDIILNTLFDYLKNSIYINCLNKTICSFNFSKSEEIYLYRYIKNHDEKELNKFLKEIGYNSEVEFMSNNNKKEIKIRTSLEKEVGIRKIGTKVTMPLALESAGNQSFMNVILPILYTKKNNCMLIIDEFSSGMHNEMEEALIKYFFNNSKDSQMFLASNSTNILSNFYLRPDQIYSLEFNSKAGTIIKRFSDENPRESQNLEKMYLNGVFDGKPTYNKNIKSK